MYTSKTETRSSHTDLGIIRMDENCSEVDIYVREAIDNTITAEAEIKLSREDFIDLIAPILNVSGYRLRFDQKVV